MGPALVGKQGKAIKKLSQSMGGVILNVVDGVCRGRAASEEEARDATRKLEERVREGGDTPVDRPGGCGVEVVRRAAVCWPWFGDLFGHLAI